GGSCCRGHRRYSVGEMGELDTGIVAGQRPFVKKPRLRQTNILHRGESIFCLPMATLRRPFVGKHHLEAGEMKKRFVIPVFALVCMAFAVQSGAQDKKDVDRKDQDKKV